jgi:heme/copper-type cytochrome/quinol oxidase subunit 2
LALRAIDLEDPAILSIQIWTVSSTLIATGLLLWAFWQGRKAKSAGIASAPVKLEIVLVAVWWLMVIGVCAYGFMLGMAG